MEKLFFQQIDSFFILDSYQPQNFTDEDGNKVIIEYRENEDGKKVKVYKRKRGTMKR